MTCRLSGKSSKNSIVQVRCIVVPVIIPVTTNDDGNCRNFFMYSTEINKKSVTYASRDYSTSDDIVQDLIIFA